MVKFKRNLYLPNCSHPLDRGSLSLVPGQRQSKVLAALQTRFPLIAFVLGTRARGQKRFAKRPPSPLSPHSRDRRDNDLLNFDQDRSSLGNICVTRILESRTPVGEKSECMFLVLSCLREQHLSGSNATHLRFDFDILLPCCVLKFHTAHLYMDSLAQFPTLHSHKLTDVPASHFVVKNVFTLSGFMSRIPRNLNLLFEVRFV